MKVLLLTIGVFASLTSVASSADYFPMAVGNEWNYSLTSEGMTTTIQMRIDQKNISGTDTIFLFNHNYSIDTVSETYTEYMFTSANDIFGFDSTKILEHRPAAGHTWTSLSGVIFTFVEYGSITVPAGVFTSCYALVMNGDTVMVVAPDVGLVCFLSDGERLPLVSYTVNLPSPVQFSLQRTIENRSISSGLHTIINPLGRRLNRTSSNRYHSLQRELTPGIYFEYDKSAHTSGSFTTNKRCIYGR